MEIAAIGALAVVQDDTQVQVGIKIQPGTLILTREGTEFTALHALVQFVSSEYPWLAQQVEFSTRGPDGELARWTVDLLNDTWDGPRDGLPTAIWKAVDLAATCAGDVGITYASPAHT